MVVLSIVLFLHFYSKLITFLFFFILFYVTDGNIMYLTDASRFLISCVIQHYAPVVGWGGGGTDA
jgi:hypothetical protein